MSIVAYLEGAEVGSGSASLSLAAGGRSTAKVQLAYSQSLTGNLDFTIAWPASIASSASGSISGYALTTSIGSDTLLSGVSCHQARFTCSSLASGSHVLEITFTNEVGTIVGYATEAVNIWDGITSDEWIDAKGELASSRAFSAAELFDSTVSLASLSLIGLSAAYNESAPEDLEASTSLLAVGGAIGFTPVQNVPGQGIAYSWNSSPDTAISSGANSGDLAVIASATDGANVLEIRVTAPNGSDAKTYTITIHKAYAVRFDLNDGTTSDGEPIAEQIVAHGGYATKPSATLTRSGFAFVGWYSDAALKSAWDFASSAVTATTTIYAKWTGGTLVNFSLNPEYRSLSFDPSTVAILRGEETTFSCSDAYLSGGTWSWYVDTVAVSGETSSSYTFSSTDLGSFAIGCRVSYGGVAYSGSALVTVSEAYTLSYSGNGNTGGSAPATATYASEEEVTVSANAGSLVKAGYSFSGWATGASATSAAYSATGSETFTMPSANVVLYAVWKNVAPGEITGLKVVGASSYLNLTWADPSDADLSYVEVDYTVGGTTTKAKLSKGTQGLLVTGLSTAMYTWFPFTFTSWDSTGLGSTGFTTYVSPAASIPVVVTPTCTVSTLAGSTTAGYVDATGTAARFNKPTGLATDGTYLYVCDDFGERIRVIEIATGAVTTLAGSGTAGYKDDTGTAAQFNSPAGLAMDGTNLYVADYQNNCIRTVVIATGVVTTLAGSTTAGHVDDFGTSASFKNPIGVATDGTYVYVADDGNSLIRKIKIATQEVTTLAGTVGVSDYLDATGTAAKFNNPTGIATDGINLYIGDAYNYRIRQICIATGEVTTLAGSGDAACVDGTGTEASFNSPGGLTTDGEYIYVSGQSDNTIRRIVISTKVVTTIAGTAGLSGSADGAGTTATFSAPRCVATDGTNLFVADNNNNMIREITP